MQDAAVREEVQALEELLERVETLPEGRAREDALAAIQGLLRVYGEALRRIVQRLGAERVQPLLDDELISNLLLLHEHSPAPLEERIAAALEEVRPYMGSHGGGIELVGVSDGVARVRLEGTCSGCAASTVTLKLAVEEAVLRAAPELHAVEAIEEQEQPAGPADGIGPAGLSLPMFDPVAATSSGRWVDAGELSGLEDAGALRLEIEATPIVFARAGGELYAYRDHCPACRQELRDPTLEDGALTCQACRRRYDVRRAGVGIDGGLLQLDPVPLLVEDGRVRIALEAVPV